MIKVAAILSILAFQSQVLASPLNKRQAGQGCAALSGTKGGASVVPSLVKDCLESTPFYEDIRRNNIDYLRGMLDVDIFEADQKYAEDPRVKQGVDVKGKLDEFEHKQYSSDYEFQTDVSDTFRALNDGHYSWSTCYNNFRTQHGLPIVAFARSSGARPSILVAPDLKLWSERLQKLDSDIYKGINIDQVIGAEITQIEGRPVWDFLEEAANDVGTYQDYEQRFNSLFAHNGPIGGKWGHNLGKFPSVFRKFDKDSFSMTVVTKDGQKLDLNVPIRAVWSPSGTFSYESGSDYVERLCRTTSRNGSPSPVPFFPPTPEPNPPFTLEDASPAGLKKRDDGEQPSPFEEPSIFTQPTPAEIKQKVQNLNPFDATTQRRVEAGCPNQGNYWPTVNDPMQRSEYLGGRDVQVYLLDSKKTGGVKTGAVFVSTLSPSGWSQCFNKFIVDIFVGLKKLEDQGVERLIIETSNNGGGYIYLSAVLQWALSSNEYLSKLNFDVVQRKSPITVGAVEQAVTNTRSRTSFDPETWTTPDTLQVLDSTTNYMEPGLNHTVGPQTIQTSNLLKFAEQDFDDLDVPAPQSKWGGNNIVFTGNGLCGSACGALSHFLYDFKGARGVISTPRVDQQVSFAAFSSGNSVGSRAIDSEFRQLEFDATKFRPDVNTASTMYFSLSASVAPEGGFNQYKPLVSESSFALTEETYNDAIAKWEAVALQAWP